MIDTHCHIDTEQFDEDREETVKRAFESGVEKIVIPAIEPKDYDNLINFVNTHDNIFCGMGVHPHNSDQFNDSVAEVIEKNALDNEKVKAIGEIGLDYYYDFVPKEKQKEAFRRQLQIAKKLDLPVIIHNRESEEDLLEILEAEQDGTLRGVVHCFSSPLDIMNKVIELGLHVSFTGNVTFKKSEHREVLENVPNDKFMIETDSPYMAPVPKRGKRNEPSYLKFIAEKIAEIKSIPINEVIKMTTENANRFFRLSVLLLMLTFVNVNLFAQNDNEENYPEDDGYYYEEGVHPYEKFIGFGPIVGSNTLVTTFRNNDDKVSDKVLLGYGVSADYQVFDYLLIDFSYLYTKNENNVIEVQGLKNKPNYDHLFDITGQIIFNPYNRVNFFSSIGFSYLTTEVSQIKYTDKEIYIQNSTTSNFGIAAGIGLIVNIPIKSAGLFTFNAEWRLNFMLNDVTLDNDTRYYMHANDPDSKYYNSVDIGKFYSIPRITLKWYPPFRK